MTQRNYFGGAVPRLRHPHRARASPTGPSCSTRSACPPCELGEGWAERPAFRELFEADGPGRRSSLPVDPEQTYLPKITSRVTATGSMESNPLHLMSPDLPDDVAARGVPVPRGPRLTRTVLVTGASRGIGAAIAAAFGDEGHEVLAPPRSELDLADVDAVASWCRSLDRDVDVLVNNAGINPVAPLADLELEDWRTSLDVNLSAPFALIRALAPRMADRGWGRIVNVGSAYSLVSRAGRGAYTAAKHGLAGLTKTAAIEYAPQGVLVNAVCPGFVATDMTYRNNDEATIAGLVAQIPAGRLAEPADVAELVCWLGSARNAYVAGQVIGVDGGYLAT